VHSLVLGMLLHAKIHNDLKALDDLEPAVLELMGARELAA
jgi:hypothetical protein